MTIARGAALGVLALMIVAIFVVMFGNGGGASYKLEFISANQLVKGNQVKVGGTPVGKITKIELSDNNQAQITVKINDDFAPLHEDSKAVIRQSSLSGVANRYISLTPGPNSGEKLDEGAVIQTDKTTTSVDLDQLFNTLDPATQKGLQQVVQGFGTWYAGRRADTSLASKYFNPALAEFTEVEKQLLSDQDTFTKLIVEGSRALGAIASRRDDLTNLVSNGNAMNRAIGAENASLAQALGLLPSTLTNGSDAFVRLRGTLKDLNKLTNVTREQLPGLAPFLNQLGTLAAESRPAIRDFRYIVNTSGPNNDITDLTAAFPGLQSTASKSFASSESALKKSDPVINFIRPYTPEITSWLTKFGQTAAYYDAEGHYARVMPGLSAFAYDQPTNTLNALSPSERAGTLVYNGAIKRCPGAATQAAPDGSSPFTDDGQLTATDCTPSIVPPGP
jgi:phospholipid/cholesterol/gamma-HCH transport system substrate-binding protein